MLPRVSRRRLQLGESGKCENHLWTAIDYLNVSVAQIDPSGVDDDDIIPRLCPVVLKLWLSVVR